METFCWRSINRLTGPGWVVAHPLAQGMQIDVFEEDEAACYTRLALDAKTKENVEAIVLGPPAIRGILELHRSPFKIGDYHPRIWRGTSNPPMHLLHEVAWSASRQVVSSLLAGLERIFAFIQPCPENATAFGHEMRTVIMLACTEVESALKSVLKANHFQGSEQNWNMKAYYALNEPLKLSDWCLSLSGYPEFPHFWPFEDWGNGDYKRLPWYDVYNQIKHDRESALMKATLECAIHSAGAAFALLLAQFGTDEVENAHQLGMFKIMNVPRWKSEEHYPPPYLDPLKSEDYQELLLDQDSWADLWTRIDWNPTSTGTKP